MFLSAWRSRNKLGQSVVTCHLELLRNLSSAKTANIMHAFISFSWVCCCWHCTNKTSHSPFDHSDSCPFSVTETIHTSVDSEGEALVSDQSSFATLSLLENWFSSQVLFWLAWWIIGNQQECSQVYSLHFKLRGCCK